MSSASIVSKIKSGLSKAVKATGSNKSEPVFLVVTTSTSTSPLDAGATVTVETLLVNAIFKSYSLALVGASILTGDRELVSDSDVEIKTGDTIRQGNTKYVVISTEKVSPTSDVLIYKSQVRLK